jgi:hypothetical protein
MSSRILEEEGSGWYTVMVPAEGTEGTARIHQHRRNRTYTSVEKGNKRWKIVLSITPWLVIDWSLVIGWSFEYFRMQVKNPQDYVLSGTFCTFQRDTTFLVPMNVEIFFTRRDSIRDKLEDDAIYPKFAFFLHNCDCSLIVCL